VAAGKAGPLSGLDLKREQGGYSPSANEKPGAVSWPGAIRQFLFPE
jgi:hypothetical protein